MQACKHERSMNDLQRQSFAGLAGLRRAFRLVTLPSGPTSTKPWSCRSVVCGSWFGCWLFLYFPLWLLLRKIRFMASWYWTMLNASFAHVAPVARGKCSPPGSLLELEVSEMHTDAQTLLLASKRFHKQQHAESTAHRKKYSRTLPKPAEHKRNLLFLLSLAANLYTGHDGGKF